MENKLKHLDFIQNIITRMNTNSFLIKGWTITLVAALFALAAKDSDKNFIIIGLFPTMIFWFLDAFYLRKERLFRCLYDEVRNVEESKIDFNMRTGKFKSNKEVKFPKVFISKSIFSFYISILIIIVVIIFYLNCWKGYC